MKKIVTIVGARPQFIKAATVSRAIRASGGAHEVLVHTGQHYDDDMSARFFRELQLPQADYNLGVGSGSHGAQTGLMLERVEQVLLDERPDWVLVYGDTNSTLAGALAAAKLRIASAHVEAGLRSWNRAMPEEINRVVADHVCDLLFAPTDTAVRNLAAEGIAPARTLQVGDVMYDAILHYGHLAAERSTILDKLKVDSGTYVLCTIHRAENTDSAARLKAIFAALQRISAFVPVVMPLHPRTRRALGEAGIDVSGSLGLHLIGPVGYLDMLALERHARLIATDSGGVQKEAYSNRVACCTLRTETEWLELVEAGWNVVVAPDDAEQLVHALRTSLDRKLPEWVPLYGTGNAAEQIVNRLLRGAA